METVTTSSTTVNFRMVTVVENAKNLQEGWYRRVEVTMDEGEWKGEAYSIHAETGNREFRGCAILSKHEELMDKAYEWVDYIEEYFF